MKKREFLVALVFPSLVLSGCAGMNHIGYSCVGQPKSAIVQKFGPPEEVIESIEDAETWEYTMGGGVQTYTFQGDTCVKQNSRAEK